MAVAKVYKQALALPQLVILRRQRYKVLQAYHTTDYDLHSGYHYHENIHFCSPRFGLREYHRQCGRRRLLQRRKL